MKRGRMQAKDIPDADMLTAVRAASDKTFARGHGCRWAFASEIEELLPAVHRKVAMAKLASLIRRKMITGCACGCRGDFELTDNGRGVLGEGPMRRVTT